MTNINLPTIQVLLYAKYHNTSVLHQKLTYTREDEKRNEVWTIIMVALDDI